MNKYDDYHKKMKKMKRLLAVLKSFILYIFNLKLLIFNLKKSDLE